MEILFNPYELQYLQQTIVRWSFYKGIGTFTPEEVSIITSIKTKVQVVAGVPVSFTPAESNFLQSLLYMGKQDYGRGSGNSVFETGVRLQVQQRSVALNASILAKLHGQPAPIINVPEQADPGALS